jgi:hypothetical protein
MADETKDEVQRKRGREAELAAALRANLRRRKAGAAKRPSSQPPKKEREEL